MHKYSKIISAMREMVFPPPINEPLRDECLPLEKSLVAFSEAAWPQIEGGKAFAKLWHVECLCEHLEGVVRGQIKKLLVSIPPRTSKTTTISIMLPAWGWLQDPELKFLYCSHTRSLAHDASLACRLLIASPWYQERWGHRIRLSKEQATKSYFINTAHGDRRATSVQAQAIGQGGAIKVMDDPNGTDESEIVRMKTNNWVSRVWPSRSNPGSLEAEILVQQRTNEMDVSGWVLSKDEDKDWVKLILPMEYETATRCRTIILPSTKGAVWEDPRTTEGELLCPNYITPKRIRELKTELGSYAYAAQYQQRPSPEIGGIINKAWWQIWKADNPPALEYIIQSWDTALTAKETSSYSACSTWGIFKIKETSHLILLSAYRGILNFPDLLQRAHRLYNNYADIGEEPKKRSIKMMPDTVIIEAKSSGYSLAEDFISKGIPTHGFNPDKYGDKMQRVHKVTPYIENGIVWVAARAPEFIHLRPDHQMFVENCSLFPNAQSRDLVDSMTQAILYLTKVKGLVKHSMDFGFNTLEISEEHLPGFRSKETLKVAGGFKNGT